MATYEIPRVNGASTSCELFVQWYFDPLQVQVLDGPDDEGNMFERPGKVKQFRPAYQIQSGRFFFSFLILWNNLF